MLLLKGCKGVDKSDSLAASGLESAARRRLNGTAAESKETRAHTCTTNHGASLITQDSLLDVCLS